MKKTSLYIDPDLDLALARKAAAGGMTKAELIRVTLRESVSDSTRVMPQACGVFAGPPELSERVDEELAAAGFGEP